MSKEAPQFSDCLYFSANALGRVLTKMAEEEFSITGLPPSYAFVLRAANHQPGIQPKELSREMMLSPSTITRLVDKLVRNGFLTRRTEGRSCLIHPTQKSFDLGETIEVAWRNLNQRYCALLGENIASELTVKAYQATKALEN